jgi:hypothetical protein
MSFTKTIITTILASYIGFSSISGQISAKKGSGTIYNYNRPKIEYFLDSLARDPNTTFEDA